jgi:hypothetical protein
MSEQPILAHFTTKRYSPGTECQFKQVMLKARGHGEVIVTPIVDGDEKVNYKLHFFFNDDTHSEEQFAPRANNPFSWIGHDIQLKVECNGADEDITIYPPQIGYRPLKLKEGGKRSSSPAPAGNLF